MYINDISVYGGFKGLCELVLTQFTILCNHLFYNNLNRVYFIICNKFAIISYLRVWKKQNFPY